MDIERHVQAIQADLLSAASLGDEAAAVAGERLAAAVASSLQLRLLDVLTEATLALNAQLSTGHVEVRLAGRDPELVLVEDRPSGADSPPSPGDDLSARITLRLPEALKTQIEAVASTEGVSANAWIVRGALALTRAARWQDPRRQPPSGLRKQLGEEKDHDHLPVPIRQRRPSRLGRVAPATSSAGWRACRTATLAAPRSAIMTIFEPTGHVAVKVTLAGGEVTVQASELPGVEVELVPLRDNDVTRKAIADARVEMVGNGARQEVVVNLGKSNGFTIGRGPKVGVHVRCPRGSDLGVRSSSADIETTGMLGSVEVKTASGDVSVEDVGAADISTASGDVRVRDAEQALSIRTLSGDVSVGHCRGTLSINLVSGDLSIVDAAAGFHVGTVSGDVRVQAGGGGPMQVGSVSGDVHLAIRPGEHLYIDASSLSGEMSSELGLEDAPPVGSEAHFYELSVRTVSGDVQIVRAAVARV